MLQVQEMDSSTAARPSALVTWVEGCPLTTTPVGDPAVVEGGVAHHAPRTALARLWAAIVRVG